jgi:hypothetical protein
MYFSTNGTEATFANNYTVIHSGNIGSQSVNYATSAGNADTVDNHHASYFHRNHRTDITDLTKAINSDTVTFDKSNFTGAPDNSTAYFNGFVSAHSNYLSSFIVNKHRSNDWWVGYIDTK